VVDLDPQDNLEHLDLLVQLEKEVDLVNVVLLVKEVAVEKLDLLDTLVAEEEMANVAQPVPPDRQVLLDFLDHEENEVALDQLVNLEALEN